VATSIKGLIGALLCVAMLNVAPAQSEEPATKDLPVTGGQVAGIEPGAQQPASIFESNEPLPLKVGSTATQSAIEQSASRVEFISATKTAKVYIGEASLLAVSNGSVSLDRASRISATINKIRWDRTPATAIRVSFNGKNYRVIVNKNTEIVTIDRTIRVSPSEKLSEKASALLIANRLRRFFGDAPVLSEVDGPAVAAQSNGVVVSVLQGVASWYSEPSGQTASGMIMRRDSMIAAHKHLPFGTVLRVTNVANGKQVNVKVMDRGPFVRNRVLDLSERAASLLGMMGSGVAHVKIEIVR
jgi:rare lipoprotein A